MEKIRQDFALNPSPAKIEEELSTYNEIDGSFTDIDYASIQRTNWPPLTHIDRLYNFAFAYTNPQNKYYEDEILKGITQVAMYTRGTRFAIPREKMALLSKFMRETYYSVIRGQYMLFDVLGRGISRPGVTNKSHTALFAKHMAELDNEHANQFKDIIKRLKGEKTAEYALKPSHTHYFRGDYTLHVRSGYTFDVRMTSIHTMRCEYGNGENLKTYFMSDGCTDIVTTGNEYVDIFPVWN